MKKIFFSLAMLLTSVSTWATSEWTAGDDVAYYLYNVESGMFLKATNDWGTRAGLSEEGSTFKLNASGDDIILKWTERGNGLFFNSTTSMYVDMGSQGHNIWSITKNSDGTCYIQATSSDDTYGGSTKYKQAHIGYNMNYISGSSGGNNYNLLPIGADFAKDAAVTWVIMTGDEYSAAKDNAKAAIDARKAAWSTVKSAKNSTLSEEMKAQLAIIYAPASTADQVTAATTALQTLLKAGGSKEAPVDWTFLVANPSFEEADAAGWTTTGVNNKRGGESANYIAESWRQGSGFTLQQTISDLPNGVYKVFCQGACNDYNNSGNIPTLIANGTSDVKFLNMTQNESSMGGVSLSFNAGLYYTEVAEAMVTDGTLTIGATCTNTALWALFDNFHIQYLGVDLTALKNNLADRISVAEGITGKMDANYASALASALTDAKNCAETQEALESATSALNTAITNASASASTYAVAKTRRDQYAARAEAAAVSVSTTNFDSKYENGTLSADDTELNEIKTALTNQVSKIVAAYASKTDLINNNGFDDPRSIEGWTAEGLHIAGNTNFSKYSGKDFVEYWTGGGGKLSNGYIKQTISSLPAGTYILTAEAQLLQQGNSSVIPGGMFLYANEKQVEVTNIADTYVVAFTLTETTDVEIGAKLDGCTGNWACVDNFQLKTLALVEGPMNATVASAQTSAYNTYSTNKTDENFEALLAAMANANVSADVYKAINTAITTAAANVETLDEAGKAAYDASTVQTKYNNGTYENVADAKTELNAALVTAVKAQTTAGADMTLAVANAACDNDMPSNPGGWADARVNTANWNIYDADENLVANNGTMHVNTWSNEGDSDGSNMKVVFTELWGYNPAAKVSVKHDQITGLKKGYYTVNILARVRDLKDGATQPTGLTFKANDIASKTAWTEGTSCAYATLTTTCEVTEVGTLDFGFEYNNQNFTWLSFKNVTLTYVGDFVPATAEEIAALNDAITAAEAKTIGYLEGDYSPYANAAALKSLADAKAIDTTVPVNVVTINDAKNELNNATWTANAKQVNAIFNGDLEGSYAAKSDAGVSSDRAIYVPEGWTVAYTGNSNDMTVLNSSDLAASSFSSITALENGGNNTYLYRGKWGNNTNIKVYQNITLPAGMYTLSCDAWKSGLGGNANIFVDEATASLAENATAWKPLSLTFTLTEKKTVKVGFNITHNSDGSEKFVGFDNFDLKLADIARTTTEGKYGTICVPFAATATGATVYSASINTEKNVVELEETVSMVAGTPYIYKANADAQTFSYASGSLVATPVAAAPLVGVFTATAVPVGSYVMQTKDDVQKFYVVEEGSQPTLSANKAYLTVPSSVKAFSIGAADEDAIQAIEALTSGEAKIYDLNGRQLKSLQKGINIVNGVKVLVK